MAPATRTGGGELAADTSIWSGRSPILLPAAVSLSEGLWSLLSPMEMSLADSSLPLLRDFSEPFHDESSQVWPVKLFN